MRRGIVMLAVLATVIITGGCKGEELTTISYSPAFTTMVTEGNVTNVAIHRDLSSIHYLRGENTSGQYPTRFKVYVPNVDDVQQLLINNDVQFSVHKTPVARRLVISSLPTILIGILWLALPIFILWLALRLVSAVEQIAKNTEKK